MVLEAVKPKCYGIVNLIKFLHVILDNEVNVRITFQSLPYSFVRVILTNCIFLIFFGVI